MSIWDRIRGEFIDIIEWTDDTPDTLVYRFERHNNEIKYGARLTVREGQTAVFVNEGEIADVATPGMYTLNTQNLPILSTLQGWKFGFESPFKAEVYFVSMRQFVDLKWGTKNPIMMRDPEFGPVRLRAFGTYAIRAKDPAAIIRQIVGTRGHFAAGEIADQLRNLIVARFADTVAESKLAVLDLAANYDEFGVLLQQKLQSEFDELGLELTKLLIENISLPQVVEEALDKRTSMGVIGNLGAYTQYQMAQSLEKAAENPGGTAAGGIGMGMGFAMANQMGQMMTQGSTAHQTPPPPPVPGSVYHIATGGQATGPLDLPSIQAKVQQGQITPETLVWKPGMTGWTRAADVPELNGYFVTPPPPPPVP